MKEIIEERDATAYNGDAGLSHKLDELDQRGKKKPTVVIKSPSSK